jgi:mono/diheme cytochrome c family protein
MVRKSRVVAIAFVAVAVSCLVPSTTRSAPTPTAGELARGRSLVTFGACNDCHTAGWRESDGTIPTAKWMIGTPIGFRGPWGTVYPANVRQRFWMVDESQWLAMVRTRGGHPPMTWHDLRGLSIADQRAIYRFIRSLGPAGKPTHPDVPPDRLPDTPYYDVTPMTPAPR